LGLLPLAMAALTALVLFGSWMRSLLLLGEPPLPKAVVYAEPPLPVYSPPPHSPMEDAAVSAAAAGVLLPEPPAESCVAAAGVPLPLPRDSAPRATSRSASAKMQAARLPKTRYFLTRSEGESAWSLRDSVSGALLPAPPHLQPLPVVELTVNPMVRLGVVKNGVLSLELSCSPKGDGKICRGPNQ
jgi:hypothetical protein